jgi:hypothetical protein
MSRGRLGWLQLVSGNEEHQAKCYVEARQLLMLLLL